MAAVLALIGVTLRQNGTDVFTKFSCALAPGECVAVHGKSGSGKSALLSVLLGEYAPDEGAVEVDGVNVRTLPPPVVQLYRQRVGVMFAEPRLFADRTVLENVMLPEELRGATRHDAEEKAAAALASLGLHNVVAASPASLPDGKRRLVAAARALCGSPRIYLCDEPLAGLDPGDRLAVLSALMAEKQRGASILVCTAYPADLGSLADRTVPLALQQETPAPERPAAPPGAATVKVTAVSSGS